jgi:hypothetical protein
MIKFEDEILFDRSAAHNDSMIFGPLDCDDGQQFSPDMFLPWDSFEDLGSHNDQLYMSDSPSPSHPFDTNQAQTSHNALFDTGQFPGMHSMQSNDDNNFYFSQWLQEPECPSLDVSSSPIPIRSAVSVPQTPPTFYPYAEHHSFPQNASFSPSDFAALHPLPRSVSPSVFPTDPKSFPTQPNSIGETSLQPPTWASQLWDTSNGSYSGNSESPQFVASSSPPSRTYDTRRRSFEPRRRTSSLGQVFQSSSAPSPVHVRAPALARTYSRRAESTSVSDDRDATIRRKKRLTSPEDSRSAETVADSSPPSKSLLQPPKLAPSAWQLYFTDWISRQQATNTRKLNVAQAAKEAGQEYAMLTDAEKEPYKRRSQVLKEARERELDAYMRTLTPDDIKRENLFRTAQRKAGKSRKSNIKDPNAPKKPLSAYFMFLQRIRSDPGLVQEVFGLETETTKQSVLAAAKWRSMTDDERKPFLAQAEQEKLEYEAARRLYEEGTTSYGSSINFSILPGSPDTTFLALRPLKTESLGSESESEEFNTDDGTEHYIPS